MILYLDTSALLKKYFKETGSDEVVSGWREASGIVTSTVAYAEGLASIYRKKSEGTLSSRLFKTVLGSFRRDWESFIRVEVTDDLNKTIDRIVEAHPLRGFDAIHLASALIIGRNLSEDFLFACFDRRLLTAARAIGLKTLPRL